MYFNSPKLTSLFLISFSDLSVINMYEQPTGADPTVENVNGHKPIDYTKNQSLQMVLATAETKVRPLYTM